MNVDPSLTWKFILLLLCLVLSGLFSASETALMTLSKIRIKQMVEDGVKNADIVNDLTDNPNNLLSAILIGNNVVNIGASSLMTSLAIDAFGNKGVGIATGVMTLLILMFGEITPKSLAAQNAERISIKVSKFIYFITIVFKPLIFILTSVTNIFIKMFGGDIDKNQPFITQEELRSIVTVSYSEGVLEGEERDMICNIFDFGDSHISDVMVNRTEMLSIDVDSSYEELLDTLHENRFSRMPVYEDSIDNIIGMLYVKDLLFLNIEKKDFNIRNYLREPYFTYEFKMVKDIFSEMRRDRIHIAVVLNEYGGTEGLVTIEDLIEEIVGDIEDEYDEETEDIKVINDDEFLVYGNVKIEDLNDDIGLEIETEDFDSIGGFVIGLLGSLPDVGDTLKYENISFVVEEVDRNKIEKVRIIIEKKDEENELIV